jgi:hypothetical protein
MPRIQPPNNYYTSTQVKQILNISGAMIANYVEKGRIKHVVPAGRKHGFYLKEDVDKLASELQAFFDLEEETESTTFSPATIADLPDCIALNRELFKVEYGTDDATLIKKWTSWINKNPEIVHVLKRDNEVIGITTVLPIKMKSPRFDKALKGDISFLLGDVEIELDDLEEYKAGNHIRLYIAEIGIKQTLSKDLRRRYGAKLIYKFMDTIIGLGKRGVIIDHMTSVGTSRSGVKLLQHFGFREVEFSRKDTRLFMLDIKTSGAPLTIHYKEALKEHEMRNTNETHR